MGRRAKSGEPMKHLLEFVAHPPETDECVEWPFARVPDGYGSVTIDGRQKGVHRLTLEAVAGPPPHPRSQARHSCDNPPCHNPRHLSWGTNRQNMADKAARGRAVMGESHPQARLTDEQVIEIRSRYEAGETLRELADEFSYSQSGIYALVTNRVRKL